MSAIENTSQTIKDDALLILADAMTNPNAGTNFIEAQEARGQRQLVNSDRLPTDMRGEESEFLALGFTFGDPDPGDPMFRPATLPAGWSRQPTDHSMWSKIVDEHSRERVSIFYKAAFYDRSAFMRLNTPYSYLNNCLYHKATPVLDETWLTRTVALETLAQLRDEASKRATEAEEYAVRDGGAGYWADRVPELRAEAAEAERLRAQIEATK